MKVNERKCCIHAGTAYLKIYYKIKTNEILSFHGSRTKVWLDETYQLYDSETFVQSHVDGTII